MQPTDELLQLARDIAVKHQLSPPLVCAIVEQESGWDTKAVRYEPAFFTRYIVPLGLPELEGQERATSWGLCQVMQQTAIEAGFEGKGPDLLEPAVGLEWGCVVFEKKLEHSNFDAYNALLRWNGGGNPNYPSQVIDRMDRYVAHLNTMDNPQHIDMTDGLD